MSRAIDREQKARRAFTLIEMLAVITVIGILCSILFKLGMWVLENNERNKAETELGGFRAMLDEYKTSNRRYPQTEGLSEEKAMSGRLYMALSGLADSLGNDFEVDDQRTSYIRNIPLTVDDENAIFFDMDPWESPYVYQCPDPDGARDFILFSKGPDGRASTDSDGNPEDDDDNIPSNYPSGEF